MIKRVLILMMVCALLLPAQALANDAFHYDYNGEDLQITVKRLQSDFSIGEDYSFSVTITNTSEHKTVLNSIGSFLFADSFYIYDFGPDADRNLEPGEKLTLTCTAEVPFNITWYRKDKDFYYDLILSVSYTIFFSDDADDYVDAESVDQPVAIKINNLSDGSEYLSMEYLNMDSNCIFIKDDFDTNYESYDSSLENTIYVTNNSDHTLQKFYFSGSHKSKSSLLVGDIKNSTLAPHTKKDYTIVSHYGLILENLPDSITDRHQAIFMVDGKYYAVGLEKEIDMQVAVYPYLDCTINEIDGELQVTFENNTGFDFENFYFGEPFDLSSEIAVIDESSLMPVFANGKKAEFTVKKYQGYEYYIGYILGGYFFKWEAELYKGDGGIPIVLLANLTSMIISFYPM